MKFMQIKFLEAVKQGRVTRGASVMVSEVLSKQFQRRATADFAEADAAGYLQPYANGDATPIRLSEAGEQALADALAERAAAR